MTQLQRFQSAIAGSDFDAAIISSTTNQRYLSDFDYTDGYLLVSADKAYLLADFRYIESARKEVKEFEVIRPEGSMTDALAELIAGNKYLNIAIEETELSYSGFDGLKNKFENCNLLGGASKILSEQRMVKLPYEIELMTKAQEITDMAFAHILGFITPDVTEIDVALELEFFMRRHGAEAIAFDTIAVSGPASSLPHGVPSDVKLRRGFLTMDFGARYKGYCSDMTRTVVIGKADEDIKKVYNTVLAAQLAALDKMQAGMRCRDADEIARSVIREAGFGTAFGHSLGHGVGMFVHESPSVSPKSAEDSILCPGHVVTVEPGIYLESKYGCRIEDMVAIKDDGTLYNFTKSPKELIEI